MRTRDEEDGPGDPGGIIIMIRDTDFYLLDAKDPLNTYLN